MDPITHLLTGATLARTGCNRKTALATPVMIVAAAAADLDIVAYLGGDIFGFIQHRGISHTLLAIPFIALFAVATAWALDALWQRIRKSKAKLAPPRWGLLFCYASIAALSHLLMDVTNNYGVRPFYPFNSTWYAWDIVYIIEPLILVALIAALALPWLFGLISQEVSSRRSPQPAGRSAAIAALIFIVALWGVRDYQHRRALEAIDAIQFHGESARRVAAFPYMVNPFHWAGVAETSTAYVTMHVDSLRPLADADNRAQSYYKPDSSPALTAARQTRLGRAYLDWSRFPLLEAETLTTPAGGTLVRLHDMRFAYPDRTIWYLGAFIELDSNLRLRREGFEHPGR